MTSVATVVSSCPLKARLPEKVGFRLGEDQAKCPKEWWHSSEGFPVGTIGQFDADRSYPWDPFVKVWESDTVNENGVREIGMIFPRIRVTKDGTLEFGVDRTTEPDFVYEKKCKCQIYQGCDFICECEAEKDNVKAYAETFQVAPADIEYNVIVWNQKSVWTWIDYPPKLDDTPLLPLSGSYCIGCRDSHA